MPELVAPSDRASSERLYRSPICKFPSLCVILFKHCLLIADELFVGQSVESSEDLQATAADGVERAMELETAVSSRNNGE